VSQLFLDSRFRDNVLQKAGSEVRRRFIQHYCDYAVEIHTEAVLRDKSEVLDFSSYLSFRRETSGVRYTFDIVEYCLGLNLPQYVHDDPVFATASTAGMDLIFWTNVRRDFRCSPFVDILYRRISTRTTWNNPRVIITTVPT